MGTEGDAESLTDAAAGAIPFHGIPDGARRRDSDAHGRLVTVERAEGEQSVVARDAFRPDTRDVFPSPQSRGVHHSVAKRR